jgi:hypothetical protein
MPRSEDWTPPTYTRCQFCKCLWEPYYGSLDIDDEVAPAIIVYTCINCLPKKRKKDKKKAMGK